MPSVVLSPDSDYNFPPAPAPATLDRAVWNAVMTSIGARMRALEAVGTGIEAIQQQLSSLGLQILDQAINPLIADTQAQLAVLAQAVADMIAQNGQVIADFEASTAAALAQLDATIATAIADLNGQIAAVQAQVDEILAGGIPADNVSETATRVFVTPAQRAEIDQLRVDLDAVTASLGDLAEFLTNQIIAITYGSLRPVASYTTNAALTNGAWAEFDTTESVLTATLPAAPANGVTVSIARRGTNNVVVDRNGQTISGLAENLTIDEDNVMIQFRFVNGTWRWSPGSFF